MQGIRIALDPGHMGGDEWDRITGKFIRDKDGTKLSEGVMATQVTLLLKRELENLGAQVMITRYEIGSVSEVPYKELELTEYAHYELQEAVYQDWFQALIARAPAGPELFKLFEKSPQLRKVYSEDMRWKYYVHRADLWERVKRIKEFNPDLALVVHFDISSAANDPNGVNPALKRNMTKAYVPGAFFGEELASREDRMHFGRHVMDPVAWWGSVDLSRSVAHAFRDRMGIPLQTAHSDNAIKVEDGVFARNLVLSRMLTGIPVSYLECLFYNQRKEFDLLKRRDHRMMIGGEETWYSDRLLEVVGAIRQGVEQFVTYGIDQDSRPL
jgi:N-acetylmuramoyl-L-alanine amidase